MTESVYYSMETSFDTPMPQTTIHKKLHEKTQLQVELELETKLLENDIDKNPEIYKLNSKLNSYSNSNSSQNVGATLNQIPKFGGNLNEKGNHYIPKVITNPHPHRQSSFKLRETYADQYRHSKIIYNFIMLFLIIILIIVISTR